LRQNLAYAYALDGRWREARTMMAQDVPADEIDRRISQWAMQGRPEDAQKRVAGLLGAPVRNDPGMPQNLALTGASATEQLAAEATASVPQPVAAGGELPAAGESQVPVLVAPPTVATASEMPVAPPYSASAYAEPATAPARQPAAVDQPASASSFSTAFTEVPAPVQSSASLWSAPRKALRTVRFALPAPKPVVVHTGSHLVQLGSFSSPQGARRGWGILAARNANLREYRMVITAAVVHGKNYWRVAAAGFDAGTAHGMCSTVRNRGGVCFAYAATQAPAGALPNGTQTFSGPQFARRK
jgi:hypothetical protein